MGKIYESINPEGWEQFGYGGNLRGLLISVRRDVVERLIISEQAAYYYPRGFSENHINPTSGVGNGLNI